MYTSTWKGELTDAPRSVTSDHAYPRIARDQRGERVTRSPSSNGRQIGKVSDSVSLRWYPRPRESTAERSATKPPGIRTGNTPVGRSRETSKLPLIGQSISFSAFSRKVETSCERKSVPTVPLLKLAKRSERRRISRDFHFLYLQSRCFFLGPIISSVVALQTDLARPWPAILCLAASSLSLIVCPAILSRCHSG